MSESALPVLYRPEPEDLCREVYPAGDTGDESALAMLGGEREGEFDDLAELAAAVCGTPIALISLVDDEWLHHKGTAGLRIEQTPRAGSICDQALRQDGIFVVRDASIDVRFARLSLVARTSGVRFYAGLSLLSPSGDKIGTICVLDTIKRDLKPWQADALRKLAHQVNVLIELRMRRTLAEGFCGSMQGGAQLFAEFTNATPFACYLKDNEGRLLFYNQALSEKFGITPGEWLGKTSHEIWPAELADRVRDAEEKVFRSGNHDKLLVQLPAADGRLSPWTLYHSVYRGAMGEAMLAGMAVHADDIPRLPDATDATDGPSIDARPAF